MGRCMSASVVGGIYKNYELVYHARMARRAQHCIFDAPLCLGLREANELITGEQIG